MKYIHCFECKGTKTIYKYDIGEVTCLECRGLGIVSISDEYFEELENERIEEENRKLIERKKKLKEEERKKEIEKIEIKKRKAEYEERKKDFSRGQLILAIVSLIFGITLLITGYVFNSENNHKAFENFIVKAFCYFASFLLLCTSLSFYLERNDYFEYDDN